MGTDETHSGARRVWVVEHTFEASLANEDRLIGVFDSERAASEVLEDLKTKPGFRDRRVRSASTPAIARRWPRCTG